MTADEQEQRLRERLTANALLQTKDYTVSQDPAGIIIDRGGLVTGIWQYRAGAFEWTPAGCDGPSIVVEGLEEAIAKTLEALKLL